MTKQTPFKKQVIYDALTRPMSPDEVRRLTSTYGIGTSFGVLIAVQVAIGFLSVPIVVSLFFAHWIAGLIALIIAVFAHIGLWKLIKRGDTAAARSTLFAVENGWRFIRTIRNIAHPGMIFQIGHTRQASEVLHNTPDAQTLGFEMGNYQYTVGHGKNARTYAWGYACIELERRVPHMVLDARKTGMSLFGISLGSNLPMSFRKDQVISLEGDFNKHFVLYAPKEYEVDAHYVFTPDLMALLIDNANDLDIEVIDNRMYLYSEQRLDMSNPEVLSRIFRIIDTVGMKTYRQTDYYADENVQNRSHDIVAQPGARLKRKSAIWSIVITFGIIFVYIIISILQAVI